MGEDRIEDVDDEGIQQQLDVEAGGEDKEEVWEEEGPPAGFWLQLGTLLEKRLIIASRDRWGVFFQVSRTVNSIWRRS